MKLSEIKKLGLNENDIEVDAFRTIVSAEFARGTGKDYRISAIERALRLKIPFTTEQNTIYDMTDFVLDVKCPTCKTKAKKSGGGGSSYSMTIDYRCGKCKTVISLHFPSVGISITPKEVSK